MVFSTTTLFKGIACPEGDCCRLTNCIYSHEPNPEKQSLPADGATVRASITSGPSSPTAHEVVEPAAKRRKIAYDSLADKPPSRADVIRSQLAASRSKPPHLPEPDKTQVSQAATSKSHPPPSLVKPVSPPPKTNANTAKATSQSKASSANSSSRNGGQQPHALGPRTSEKTESLNPRLIPNDPAGHQKRALYLKALHTEMMRLNQMMKDSKGVEFQHALLCTEQELITMSLDAEEKIAREQPTLYANIVKQQVATFRKMQVEGWGAFVKASLFKDQRKSAKKEENPIDTGLPLQQEYLILPQLVADQKPLAAFGYIPTPPTEQEAAEAAAAVEASANYEICDRCSARFQVFPERNAEGLLSSNGPCKYHPNRKVFPQRSKTDRETGAKEPYYPCCNESVGSPGCTRDDEHVFKTSSPARLAATMLFINTPENPSPAKDRHGETVKAVTFDCEMGYTVYGMELVRLTAVSWPSGEELLDILVRPLGAVIDFNSRFSGVFPEHFKTAIPYDRWITSRPSNASDNAAGQQLPMVDSPQRARELLCNFITPTIPLIGHAIDNDLNTVRLCHPTIIDTVVLFPHPRGLPMRFGLKMLALRHLNRAIQQGGDRGHDSKEDAIATGDLVRVKVGDKWRALRRSGWQIVNDQLIPPSPQGKGVLDSQTASLEQSAANLVDRAASGYGQKRKKRASADGAEDGSEEDAVDG